MTKVLDSQLKSEKFIHIVYDVQISVRIMVRHPMHSKYIVSHHHRHMAHYHAQCGLLVEASIPLLTMG